MTTVPHIVHVPRPSRVAASVAARCGPPVIGGTLVAEVLDHYGVDAMGPPRNLRLSRRSLNAAVRTTHGEKVVKLYRPQWQPSTVRYGHSILLRLEELGFPAVRLERAVDGSTWTEIGSGVFAVFDLLPGTNYSLTYLLRSQRLLLTTVAGQTLGRLHRELRDFEPVGEHHHGFVSHTGPRRRDVAWHAGRIAELRRQSFELSEPGARRAAALLSTQADRLLDDIGQLDSLLAHADLPRLVIHGDYGIHNLLFSRDGAVPVDFELARLDWRVNDLVSALGKHRYRGGSYDFESMRAFMAGYLPELALTDDEQRLLPQVWRLYKLQAAVQYWSSYFETRGPVRKLESALDSIQQADHVLDRPDVLTELVTTNGHRDRTSRRERPRLRAPRPSSPARALPTPQCSPLTVMLVTPNLEIGGAQQNLLTMATHLREAGCPTVVCSFDDGPLRPEIQRVGVPVEILPQRRHSVFAGPFFVAEMLLRRRDLLEVATKYRARVVQTYGLGTLDFLVGTLRIGRKLDVWWTIENVAFMVRAEHLGRHRWLLRPKRSAHRVLYRVGARFVSGVIAVSDETERSFRESVGYEGRNVAVVLNSVDLERFPADIDRTRVRAQLGFRADDHVMTMVGTFKRQKGHRHLVEALAQLAGEHPELHLLFVGDGELMPVIDAQVRDAGLTERVHFLGSRRDVDAILAASDTFVLPSLWEGLSVALVEAMASGLPIVATDVSGTNEVMVDDSTGRLVPPGDAEALAAAIRDVLADPVLAADMGARARAHVMEICGARRQAERLAALFGRGSVESDAPDGLPLAAAAAR